MMKSGLFLVIILSIWFWQKANGFNIHNITYFSDVKCNNKSQVGSTRQFVDEQSIKLPLVGWIIANCTCMHPLETSFGPCSAWWWSYRTLNESGGWKKGEELWSNATCAGTSALRLGGIPASLGFRIQCLDPIPAITNSVAEAETYLVFDIKTIAIAIGCLIGVLVIALVAFLHMKK